MRSAKVMANALSAGFHRIVHRFCPVPVGSSDRVTRYRLSRPGFVGDRSIVLQCGFSFGSSLLLPVVVFDLGRRPVIELAV